MPDKKNEDLPIVHINYAISPQPHTSMYLMHKYWARKPHNVVGEYIEHYSKKGDVVLDPFVGSGVTAIEALRRERKAIAIDLDPISTFITRMTLIPVDLKAFKASFEQITEKVKNQIQNLYATKCPTCGKKATVLATIWQRDENKPLELRLYCTKCKKRSKKKPAPEDLEKLTEIEKMDISYWYPKDRLHYPSCQDFVKKETVGDIPNLFTKRNLIALSIICCS